MPSTFLCTSAEGDRVPQGAFGRPVTGYYPQLRAYVEERLGPEIARYFAEPMREPGEARIDWFTDSDGPATPLGDLPGAERKAAIATLRAWRRALLALAAEDPPEGAAETHRLLSLALSEPSESDVYVADGLPVVTHWGFETPADFAPNADTSPLPPPGPDSPARQAPPQAEQRRPMLDALTLCTIIAVLVAVLTGALFSMGAFGDRAPAFAAQSSPAASAEAAQLRRLQAQNDRLRTDIDALQEDFLSRTLACLGQCTAPAGPVAPETPTPETDDPAADTPPDDAPPEAEPPGEPLVVPDGAAEENDLSFLEGTWRSVSESLLLTFTGSDRPDETITVEYTLDTEGAGTRKVIMSDGTECSGTVTAGFDAENRLLIEEEGPAECGDGLQVIPYTVTCDVDADGLADCTLKPRASDSAASVETELRRVE